MARSVKIKGLKPTEFYTSEIEQLKKGFREQVGEAFIKDIELTFSS
jgi:hypothetical protein